MCGEIEREIKRCRGQEVEGDESILNQKGRMNKIGVKEYKRDTHTIFKVNIDALVEQAQNLLDITTSRGIEKRVFIRLCVCVWVWNMIDAFWWSGSTKVE